MRKPQVKMLKTRAKNARKRGCDAAATSEQTTTEKRAKAYHAMEPHVCELARAAELAMAVFDQSELFLHAVGQIDKMAQRFRANYYAEEFPPE